MGPCGPGFALGLSGQFIKETNMRKIVMTTMLLASLCSMPMVVGCDRTVKETDKTTTGPNGDQSTTASKTVEHPDGSVTTSTEKKSSAPNP